jgi:RNA polymerase sigma factor (sigma-70 family)
MVSEGVLKVYDLLDKNPETHPANLYREAKRRMHDYINFDCNGLSLPASDAARAIARGNDTSERQDYSERGLEALQAALSSEWGDYEDDLTDGNHATPEEILIDKQTNQSLTNFINTVLTEDEAELIILRYFEDATQDEVSSIFDLTQQGVALREKKALRKLKFQVCNIL